MLVSAALILIAVSWADQQRPSLFMSVPGLDFDYSGVVGTAAEPLSGTGEKPGSIRVLP